MYDEVLECARCGLIGFGLHHALQRPLGGKRVKSRFDETFPEGSVLRDVAWKAREKRSGKPSWSQLQHDIEAGV